MSYSLDQFSAECHRILAADPGVEGRKKVCAVVREVLKDDEFVKTYLGDDVPERKILFEDPELGFCILGHVHHDARDSNPHDHGPYWAIYGQAKGETVMTDYEPVARPGTLRRTHGPDFAEGFKETDKLSDVLHALDEPSLSSLIKDHQAGTLEGKIKQHS